jgi:hypothetical protein
MANNFMGDEANGFYSPQPLPYPILPSFQEFLNTTNGNLSLTIQDAIHNLLAAVPSYHGENLLLAGETVVLLRRLTSGVRCPNFNENDDQEMVSKCTICFGTGYVGGYANAREIKMSFVPGRADILIEQAGLTVTQRPTAWTIPTIPSIQEFDVIITYSNERYIVHSAENVEKQGRVAFQTLTLSRIDKDDILYYIPVPFVQGEARVDFVATLLITPVIPVGQSMPGANFEASIYIKNYNFYGSDGVTPVVDETN